MPHSHTPHVMSRSIRLAVALVPLLMIWCGVVESAPSPLFGLLTLLGASSSNSTNLLTTLATSKLQAKLTALSVLSDLIQFATLNGTLFG